MGGRNTRRLVSTPIHGLSGQLRSVQRGFKTHNAATIPGATAGATISAVVLAQAHGKVTGVQSGASNGHNAGASGRLTAATTYTIRHASTDGAVTCTSYWEVIERWA